MCLDLEGRQDHAGPDPTGILDVWGVLEGRQDCHFPFGTLLDLKRIIILTNLTLMLVSTFVSHRNEV